MYDTQELEVVFPEGDVVEVVQDADDPAPATAAVHVHACPSSSGGSGHANAVRMHPF